MIVYSKSLICILEKLVIFLGVCLVLSSRGFFLVGNGVGFFLSQTRLGTTVLSVSL